MRRITVAGRRITVVGTGTGIAAQGLGIGRAAERRCFHHVPVGGINSEYAAAFTASPLVFFKIQQAICGKGQTFAIHSQLSLCDKGGYTGSHVDSVDIDITVVSGRRTEVIGTIELPGSIVGPWVICQAGDGHPVNINWSADLTPIVSITGNIIQSIRIKGTNLIAVAARSTFANRNIECFSAGGVVGLENGPLNGTVSRLDDIVLDLRCRAGAGIDFIQITRTGIVRVTLECIELAVVSSPDRS